VQLYDFGVDDSGSFYYVMELLEGVDLQHMVKRFGPQPAERVVMLLRQACLSLAEAHEHGLVHRDIKPANLFVTRLGHEYDYVKVLDFGIVKDQSQGPRWCPQHLLPGTPASGAGDGVPEATSTAGRPHSLRVAYGRSPDGVFRRKLGGGDAPATCPDGARSPSQGHRFARRAIHEVPRRIPEPLSSALEELDRCASRKCPRDRGRTRARTWWEHLRPGG
jgi:serine/threonine protein kinase